MTKLNCLSRILYQTFF